jgi:DNA helicase IV
MIQLQENSSDANVRAARVVIGAAQLWAKITLAQLAQNDKEQKPKENTKELTKWGDTKSAFCRLVNGEYQKDLKNKIGGRKYNNHRDAIYKLFPLYEFNDKKWTVEKCYGLSRKC